MATAVSQRENEWRHSVQQTGQVRLPATSNLSPARKCGQLPVFFRCPHLYKTTQFPTMFFNCHSITFFPTCNKQKKRTQKSNNFEQWRHWRWSFSWLWLLPCWWWQQLGFQLLMHLPQVLHLMLQQLFPLSFLLSLFLHLLFSSDSPTIVTCVELRWLCFVFSSLFFSNLLRSCLVTVLFCD